MNPKPSQNGNKTSGNPLPEVNLLQEKEKTKIWQSLRNQQIKHGAHPDDHRAVKHRLEREWFMIVLTVNWVIRKLGAPTVDFTDADVHEFFKATAEGKPFTRRKKFTQWIENNWVSLLGWVTAAVILVAALMTVTRPVQVQVLAEQKSTVVEKEKLPRVIHFKQENKKSYAWEGTGDPASGDGRWVGVEFQKSE